MQENHIKCIIIKHQDKMFSHPEGRKPHYKYRTVLKVNTGLSPQTMQSRKGHSPFFSRGWEHANAELHTHGRHFRQ